MSIIKRPKSLTRRRRAIVYSLFGFNNDPQEGFTFNNFLQGLLINVRLARLIYPDWEIVLELDQASYEAYQGLFDRLPVVLEINDNGAPLCKAMLWRLKPCFHDYTHIIARDLDSPLTYRERQAVEHWISHNKTAHAITDSVSHTEPLMGGMVGFIPPYFTMRTGFSSWQQMIESTYIDFKTKGDDQTFMKQVILPKVAEPGNDSITQHYVLGIGNTFLSDYHNHIPNMELDLDPEIMESNGICGHIGAAGYYQTPCFKFLHKFKDQFEDLREIEKDYPKIFYWDEVI